jgi:hypothetical protein
VTASQKDLYLLLYGGWSDMLREPCECCGTPLVLLHNAQWIDSTMKVGTSRFMEVAWENPPGGYLNAGFRAHDSTRCHAMRESR